VPSGFCCSACEVARKCVGTIDCVYFLDTLQLLLQFEQEKGDKERLDWLVSEGKKQVWRRK
jgi:hypothetical protein